MLFSRGITRPIKTSSNLVKRKLRPRSSGPPHFPRDGQAKRRDILSHVKLFVYVENDVCGDLWLNPKTGENQNVCRNHPHDRDHVLKTGYPAFAGDKT